MPLLLGSNDVSSPPLDFDSLDLDRLFRDDDGENLTIHLVGAKKYSWKGYKREFKGIVAEDWKHFDATQLSYVFSMDQYSQGGRFEPYYYLESRQYDAVLRSFDSAVVEKQRSGGLHYFVVDSCGVPSFSIGGEKSTLLTFDEPHLFDFVSEGPVQSNIVSKKTLGGLCSNVSSAKDDLPSRLRANKYLFGTLRDLFDENDIAKVSCMNRRRINSEHRDYPIFSFEELDGKRYMDKMSQSLLKRVGIFALGTDKVIRENLTSGDRWAFHAAGLLGSIVGYCSAFNLMSSDDVMGVFEGQIAGSVALTGVFWTGLVDGLYRMVKNHKGHPRLNSGIVGGLYEKIVEGKDFF